MSSVIPMWIRRVIQVPKDETVTKSGIMELNYPQNEHLIFCMQNDEDIFKMLHPKAQDLFIEEYGVNFTLR